MTLGARIESRLDKIGISQAELARRVGLTQSSMNALIRGKTRSSRKIVSIARELRTSPEYLEGEVNDPQESAETDALSGEERELIKCFRASNPDDRKALVRLARAAANSAASPKSDGGKLVCKVTL